MAPASTASPQVLVASSGKQSELVETIPITSRRGAKPRVTMRLGPKGEQPFSRIPDLTPGDRLEVSSEVEVTTDSSPGQEVGKPYDFDPLVEAQLFLVAGPKEMKKSRKRALPLSKRKGTRIRHAQHHGVIVFGDAGLRVPDEGLPWKGESYINLVLSASDKEAQNGHLLIVGENEEDGSIGGDKGRVNAIRLRPSSLSRPRARKATKLLARELPTNNSKHVLLSLPLDKLTKGEQLVVRAQLKTSAAHLPHPARISTRLLLADSAGQDDTGGEAKKVAPCGGEAGEHNGFNCTPAKSPCRTDRVGVLLLEKNAGKKLYLNLVADSGNPTKQLAAGAKLKVEDGFLEVVRYGANLKG